MLRLLFNLTFGTLLVVAVVRSAWPAGRHEDAVQFRLRRAQWVTVAFAIPAGYLVRFCVRSLDVGGVPDPAGMIGYILLLVVLAIGGPVAWSAWRRFREARQLDRDETRRALGLSVIDGADAPGWRHRALSGEDEPPTRW